ncbi:MAG: small multi-drug export protein [Pseudoflavonifractor sp.]
MQWLTAAPVGEFVFTMLVSMVPIVELRGGIPFGVGLGLPYWVAFVAAVIGNILPIPFIVVYIRRIFKWMRRHLPKLDHLVDRLEAKAHIKGKKVSKYKYLGLMIFVAIPLPGTGAWTGALAAAFLDMPLRKALPTILAGVLIAGCIMSALTALGFGIFASALS